MVLLFYITYISVNLAHHEIFRAKVGKGGIMNNWLLQNSYYLIKCLCKVVKISHFFP